MVNYSLRKMATPLRLVVPVKYGIKNIKRIGVRLEVLGPATRNAWLLNGLSRLDQFLR